MTIYRNDNKMRKEETSNWLNEFAKYWDKAENRIKDSVKRGSYMSEIQKAMDRRSMDDVIGDLKERTGLRILEEMKKESDSEVDKKASIQDDMNIPEKLRAEPDLCENILQMIEQVPGKSYESIWHDFKFSDVLADPEVKKFLKDKINERKAKEQNPEESVSYNIDTVDAADNREIFNDGKDGFNTI